MKTYKLLLAILPLLPIAEAAAQEEAAPSLPPIRYPADKDRVVAQVNEEKITLEQVMAHIDEVHSPDFGFRAFLEQQGKHYLTSPWLARWVRHYTDIRVLQAQAQALGRDLKQARPAIDMAKKRGFEAYLSAIAQDRGKRGINFEPNRRTVQRMFAKFERERGLQAEVQGMLDFLVQLDPTDKEAREFYGKHVREFNGIIEMSHILIHTRDPRTGRLLEGEGRLRGIERITEIESRLEKNGANFDEIARLYSDDSRTASRGGKIGDVERFDDRLPAKLTKVAWSLKDGEIAGPVHTPYGAHFVKRDTLHLKQMVIYNAQLLPKIRATMLKNAQEDILLQSRQALKVKLLL